MKRIISLVLCLALLTSVMATLSSCGSSASNQTVPVYFVGNLYDFDPAMNYTNDEAAEVFNLLYEPLFTLNADGSVSGALVSDWKYDDTTRKLSMTIRTTCWSDGSEVTAEDVVFAWKRILACDFPCDAAPLLYAIENAYECKTSKLDDVSELPVGPDDIAASVDIHDNKKLIVTLKEGSDLDAFLRNLTNVAVTALNEDTVNSVQKDYWSKRTATINTSGPFLVKQLDYNMGYFKIGRNTGYRVAADVDSEKIDLTRYVLPSIVSTVWVGAGDSVRKSDGTDNKLGTEQSFYLDDLYHGDGNLTSFLNGLEKVYKDTIFYMGDLPLDQRAAAKESENLLCVDSASVYSYLFNLNNPASPLVQDAKVRKAISDLIDRTALQEEVVFGKPATGLITGGVYESGDSGSFRATADKDGTLLSVEATDAVAVAKKAITDAVRRLEGAGVDYPKNSSKTKPQLVLLCRDNEEEAAIAAAVKSVLTSVIDLKIVYLSYTYISDTVAADEGIEAKDTVMMDDALMLAWRVREDGGMYYYNFGDSARETPLRFDMIGMDFQMLSTDALVPLSLFSSNYNGNGIDTTVQTVGTESVINYSNQKSTCGWQNEEYDEKIAAAYAATDEAERATLLHEAEAILLGEAPIIPLLFNENFALVNPRLSGVTVSPFYGYMNPVRATVKNYAKLKESADAQ